MRGRSWLIGKRIQRAELEAAMQSGIAVVHYGCDGIRVLGDCKIKGEYAYASIPRGRGRAHHRTEL